jgi:hypothetical protein
VEAMVNLTSEAVGLGYVNASQGEIPFTISGHAEADGTFTLAGVPPGPYSLRASAFREKTGGMLHESASAPLVVSGGDIGGITLTMSTGGTISGTFVRDAGASQPLPRGMGVEVSGGGMSMLNSGPNGTFRLMGVIGPARISVEGLPEGWMVKSITADGVDVTDAPIAPANGRDMTVRIVLTDRVTRVSGTLSPGTPARGQTVVVFAEDSARWTYPSRFVRAVRVDDRGSFGITGLPPGERYLAAAVDFLEEGDSEDPEVLERLREGAIGFTLGEGERRTIELRTVER